MSSANDTKTAVILGATSAMARAVACEFARNGSDVILGARDQDENEAIATDIRIRFQVQATALPFVAEDVETHAAFMEQCGRLAGESIEGVVLCVGCMEDQAKAQADFDTACHVLDVNLAAAVSMLERFAAMFEARRRGVIAAVSSVAGDRGRQSNYIYGAAKAGLSTYLEGLRNRLHHAGVQVTTIKPGFVDTKMTFGLPGLFLVASPEQAGRAIHRAICARKDVVYVPWFWRYIMLIIRSIPEWKFKRMRM
jgi:short-subunit dehydrogenase